MNTSDNILYIPFVKMSAAGNDFVLVDDVQLSLQHKNYDMLARAICDRHYGVGADGLLIYKQHHPQAFEMDYYNADGSTGGMCGNGARCISAYYFDVYGKDNQSVEFMAFGHLYKAIRDKRKILVHMRDPSHLITDLTITVDGKELGCNFIDTGAPHVVVFFDELQKHYPAFKFGEFDIKNLGSSIRRHEAFRPLGTNVNFVQPLSGNDIQIRTYERGVEGETLACGTGAIASAVVSALHIRTKPPLFVHTKSGEILDVQFSHDDKYKNFSDITLSGSWRYHFTGIAYFDLNDKNKTGAIQIPDTHMQMIRSRSTKMDW